MFEKIKFWKKGLADTTAAIANFIGLGAGDNINYYQRWVYAAINTIANGIARVEWKLYQNKGGEVKEVEESEIMALLYKFNPKFTKYDSVRLTAIYWQVYGECYWLLLKDSPTARTPKEIWVVNPKNMRVTATDAKGYPTQYEYRTDKEMMSVSADSVLRLVNPNPANPMKPVSPTDAAAEVIETDWRMVRWNKNLMVNAATPSGAISVEGSLTEDQAKLMRKMFDQAYSGFNNSGKTVIMTNGAKFNPFSIPPKDLEFNLGRSANRDEILSVYGVPKILLGLEGQYNRATAETAERVFAKYTLEPLLRMIIEQLNEFFVPLFGAEFWLDFEPLAGEDKELQITEWTNGHNKWLSTNDIRRAQGLPDMQGGDMIYQPLGIAPTMTVAKMSPVGRQLNERQAAVIRKRITARNYRIKKISDSTAGTILKKMDKKVLFKVRKGIEPNKKLAIWTATIEVKRLYEKTFIEKVKKIFENQKNEVLANLGEGKAKLKKIKPAKVMFDKDEQIKTTIAIIEPEYYAAVKAGAKIAAETIGEPVIDVSTLPQVQKWIKRVATKYSEDITNNTYDLVLAQVEAGVNDGLSVVELGEKIGTYFDTMSESRSEVIARTETARALTSGQAYAWGEYGITKMEWYAEPTACDICLDLAQDDWTTKEAQQGTVNYSHPNCECTFLPL